MQSTHEEWRQVVGYRDYEVSSLGRVRSWKKPTPRILKPVKHSGDYRQVGLFQDGSSRTHLIHKLVMAAFVGPYPDGSEICHANGDRTDNRLENLRYDTHLGNMADQALHGTKAVGARLPQTRLTAEQVTEARTRWRAGESMASLQLRYGMSSGAMRSAIHATHSWKWLPQPA